MKVSFSVKQDISRWNKMKGRLLKGNKHLDVGWWSSSYGAENNNLPIAQVAKWNNEGTITSPARPFLSIDFINHCVKYLPSFAVSLNLIAQGKSNWDTEYKKLGARAKEDLQAIIDDYTDPANSPITIAIKGRDDPLVDTGLMRDSVNVRVDNG